MFVFVVHKLRSSINTTLKGILSNFVKRDLIKDNDVSKINVSDPSSYVKLDEVYHGTFVERIYLEFADKISAKELKEFQLKTLNFYVSLAKQMYQRFLSHGMFENLQLLETLDPENVIQGTPRSIVPLAIKFPNIISEENYEEVNREWRELTVQEIPQRLEKNPEKFWYNISRDNAGTSADILNYPT